MTHKIPSLLFSIPLLLLSLLASCGHSAEHRLDMARRLVDHNPDSAYITLRDVDYTDFTADSLRAKYILTRALTNNAIGRSLLTDTLLNEAVGYYSHAADTANWVKASQLLSRYDYFTGNHEAAMQRLDTLLTLVTDTTLLRDLHTSLLEIAYDTQNYPSAYNHADWLSHHSSTPDEIVDFISAKGVSDYISGNIDRAIAAYDSIISRGYLDRIDPAKAADFMVDYAELIDMAGRHSEAIALLENIDIARDSSDTVTPVLRTITKARFYANAGELDKAKEALSRINQEATISVFEVYMYQSLLKAAIRFKETGIFPSDFMYKTSKTVYSRQRITEMDHETALESVIRLNEDKYRLQLQKHRLWLLVSFVTLMLVIGAAAAYFIMARRKQRLAEAEERAETLAQMLRDAENAEKAGSHHSSGSDKLKASLLRQLGILKTFAGAPTQQSRDALKKISGVSRGTESVDTLVDWPMVYTMIDDLYDGFHYKLLHAYPDTLTDKELQIIVLLKAGFSTKEIGVLTEQSSATVYVRKTSIRKKLRTPENGDFIAQLDDLFRASAPH